jgi:hypothetical protein
MSCGVIGGDARTFFMAGTNYTGIWDAPALAGTPGRPGFQPTVPVQIRFTIVFKVLRTRQSWSGTARVGWHTGCKPTVRPPVWRAVVRPARYFLSWQKVALRRFLRNPTHFPQAKSVVFARCSAKARHCRANVDVRLRRFGPTSLCRCAADLNLTGGSTLRGGAPSARTCRNQQASARVDQSPP